MSTPLVSIIIPSLNQGIFIRKTLDSIFEQDYPNIEVIVMDGGSMDETIHIIKNYELGIRNKEHNKIDFQWVSRKDNGQANAINAGLRKSKGDIVMYLNSDDYLLPYAIQTVVKTFVTTPRLMWLTGECLIVDEKGNRIQELIRLYKKILRFVPIKLILPVANPIAQPSTFWRKVIMSDIGYFNEDLHYTFDYEYWLRVSKKYAVGVLPTALSAFRIHGASKGGILFKKQFSEELDVVKNYVSNPILLFLHAIHNKIIVGIYTMIKGYV
jgi:glycosyltransferase involved in cell wall biosynthesis